MRSECAETKVAAESKFTEAQKSIDEAQKKFTEAEAMMRAAESLQAEASRYNSIAERKFRDVEAREDNLRRQIISFKSEYVFLDNYIFIRYLLVFDPEHFLYADLIFIDEAVKSLGERNW